MFARSAAPRLLVVTAVVAERDAAAANLMAAESVLGPYATLTAPTALGRVDLLAAGAGSAAAAAGAASALAIAPYDLVLCAGVAGGFAPVEVGGTVVASAVVHADFGAETEDGFICADLLGLGPTRTELPAALVGELAARTSARTGAVVTVCTVTGSARTAADLVARHPDAVAEAMEGAGVLAAASAHGVPFAELRTISNRVGPRDRSSWQLGPALDALTVALTAVTSSPLAAGTDE